MKLRELCPRSRRLTKTEGVTPRTHGVFSSKRTLTRRQRRSDLFLARGLESLARRSRLLARGSGLLARNQRTSRKKPADFSQEARGLLARTPRTSRKNPEDFSQEP